MLFDIKIGIWKGNMLINTCINRDEKKLHKHYGSIAKFRESDVYPRKNLEPDMNQKNQSLKYNTTINEC